MAHGKLEIVFGPFYERSNGSACIKLNMGLLQLAIASLSAVATQNFTKFVLPVDKNGIFNISAQTEETETTINSNKD